MNQLKHIVIIGATSSIAEHCARSWVSFGNVRLTLVARNFNKTEQIASDLRVRSPQSTIKSIEADFIDPTAIQTLVDSLCAKNKVDIVLIAHGFLPNQSECQQDLVLTEKALNINGISPVLFAEAFVAHMEKDNHGTVAIISSVAGERGRQSNYVYGAAKGLITRYAEGLQHRLAATKVKVVVIKPGPTDTPMTAHLKGGALANVNEVAEQIVLGIDEGRPVVYTPKKWALIMMIIRHLPRFVFNKITI